MKASTAEGGLVFETLLQIAALEIIPKGGMFQETRVLGGIVALLLFAFIANLYHLRGQYANAGSFVSFLSFHCI